MTCSWLTTIPRPSILLYVCTSVRLYVDTERLRRRSAPKNSCETPPGPAGPKTKEMAGSALSELVAELIDRLQHCIQYVFVGGRGSGGRGVGGGGGGGRRRRLLLRLLPAAWQNRRTTHSPTHARTHALHPITSSSASRRRRPRTMSAGATSSSLSSRRSRRSRRTCAPSSPVCGRWPSLTISGGWVCWVGFLCGRCTRACGRL